MPRVTKLPSGFLRIEDSVGFDSHRSPEEILRDAVSRVIQFEGKIYCHHDGRFFCYDEALDGALNPILRHPLGQLALAVDHDITAPWVRLDKLPRGIRVDEHGGLELVYPSHPPPRDAR